LVFSTLQAREWSAPKEIARGSNWFVNWADFPSMVSYRGNEQNLTAHWLQMSAEGTYDYDVRITQSANGGDNWDDSFIPHKDGIPAEHGFVSLLPTDSLHTFVTWLDGRNTKPKDAHSEMGHGMGGPMTLRCALIDVYGNVSDDVELDNKTCDCCQTSAALTDQGIVVAYRDRTDDEIRDISIVRQVNGSWTKPQTIFPDNWKIAGCPVNGPAVQANGSLVAIAWLRLQLLRDCA